ncbi:MAG: cyclic nucleotide-binding domain-containing protein [Acidimicrobiales bacterium]|nr:cyclic nucleotide-binding domain-containing protein [Acidimicrobiales bacterium]
MDDSAGISLSEQIHQHAFFEGLPPDAPGLIASCGRRQTYAEGELIIGAGESAEQFFVVTQGCVSVEVSTPDDISDHGVIVIDQVDAGSVLGVSWTSAPYEWAFDGRALEDTEVIVVDVACIRRRCAGDRDFERELNQRFFALLGHRLQETRRRLLAEFTD